MNPVIYSLVTPFLLIIYLNLRLGKENRKSYIFNEVIFYVHKPIATSDISVVIVGIEGGQGPRFAPASLCNCTKCLESPSYFRLSLIDTGDGQPMKCYGAAEHFEGVVEYWSRALWGTQRLGT